MNKKYITNKLNYILESLFLTATLWQILKSFIQSQPLYHLIEKDVGIQVVNKSVINKKPDKIYGLK